MKKQTAIAALSFQIKAGSSEIQLLPAGHFRSADGSGRPAEVDSWFVDKEVADNLIALASARKTPFVVDYEHQTLLAEKNGQPAPAAGRFKTLEWREGVGLFGVNVIWTARATAMIESEEYGFISPVFDYDKKTGAVTRIRMAALTNEPGLDGMAHVALKALSHEDFQHDDEKEDSVNETLKKLLAALKLPENATEAEALAAVAALAEKVASLETETAALKASSQAPDPAGWVPVKAMQELQAGMAALTAKIAQGEAQALVEQGVRDGKLIGETMVAWAKDVGSKDLAALKSFLASAPVVAALTGTQTGGFAPAGVNAPGAHAPASAEAVAVMKAMGLSAEEFMKGAANGA